MTNHLKAAPIPYYPLFLGASVIYTDIHTAPLFLSDAEQFIESARHGAESYFVGRVRNHHDGKTVEGIMYESHETLSKKVILDIGSTLIEGREASLYLVHRVGWLTPLEASHHHRCQHTTPPRVKDACLRVYRGHQKHAPHLGKGSIMRVVKRFG